MADASAESWNVQGRVTELENGWAILTISLPDDKPELHRWGVIQHIKNQFVGAEREAFELFPAASRAVTGGRERHLHVLPEGVHLPVGMTSHGISIWSATHKPPQDVFKRAGGSRRR